VFTASPDSGNETVVTVAPAPAASVTYTNPASACPDTTLPSTSVTLDSSLTGFSVVPVAVSIFLVAAPQGTCGAQTTTCMPGFAKSATERIPFGLPGGVTMVNVLEAKLTGSPATRFAFTALVMFVVSADAKASAGAPPMSCVTSSEEPAKLNFT